MIVLCAQPVVDILRIAIDDLFGAMATTLSETPVVHHKKIIALAYIVFGKLTPALDAAAVAFEKINNSQTVWHFKPNSIDPSAIREVKLLFFKRELISTQRNLMDT